MKNPFCSVHRLAAVAIGIVSFVSAHSYSQAISVTGGNISLSITSGTAGGQLVNVINTAVTLQYQKQSALSKIDVSTSCPGQKYNLSVMATSVTKGVAAPQVSLMNGSPAVDLITSIPSTGAKNGSATLQYTASATFNQGNSTELGDDVHTITYTILAQ
jgi:hypothetical protein